MKSVPDEFEKLNDPTWKPRLHLTTRERQVVETSGTVLLLGRSGTGKTCVIGNRMDYDRQRAGDDTCFSQLFVARSKGLCDYVKEAVDGDNHASMRFETFPELVVSLETALPSLASEKKLYLRSQRMDFARFKRDFYCSDSSGGTRCPRCLDKHSEFHQGINRGTAASGCRALSEEDYLGSWNETMSTVTRPTKVCICNI